MVSVGWISFVGATNSVLCTFLGASITANIKVEVIRELVGDIAPS